MNINMKIKHSRFLSVLELSSYTFLGIVISFLSQILIAYHYGTTVLMDAYVIASTFPLLVTTYILSAVSVVVIPQYGQWKRENKSEEFTSTVFIFLLGLSALVWIIGTFITPRLLELVMPNLSEQTKSIAIQLSPLLWFSIVPQIMFGFFSAVLQSNDAFSSQGVAPLALSLCTIIAMAVFAHRFGIWAYAMGGVVGMLVQIVVVWPHLRSFWKFNPHSIEKKFIKNFLNLSWPILLGGLIIRAVPTIERVAASNLPTGTISKLNYAQRILTLASSVVLNGIIVVLFPRLSQLSHSLPDFRQQLKSAFYMVVFVLTPCLVLLCLFAAPLIKFVLVRGAFSDHDAEAVSTALLFYSPYTLAAGVGSVVAKGLYALQLVKLATVLDISGILLYAVLLFVGIKTFGGNGIPWALSVYYVVAVAITGIILWKKSAGAFKEIQPMEILKLIISNLVLFIVASQVFRFIHLHNPLISVAIASVVGLMGYVTVSYIQALAPARKIVDILRNSVQK